MMPPGARFFVLAALGLGTVLVLLAGALIIGVLTWLFF